MKHSVFTLLASGVGMAIAGSGPAIAESHGGAFAAQSRATLAISVSISPLFRPLVGGGTNFSGRPQIGSNGSMRYSVIAVAPTGRIADSAADPVSDKQGNRLVLIAPD